jgi:hypothetical protein
MNPGPLGRDPMPQTRRRFLQAAAACSAAPRRLVHDARDSPSYQSLVNLHGDTPTWANEMADVAATDQTAHRLRRQVAAACVSCGAPNPNFTEPSEAQRVGLLGMLILWLSYGYSDSFSGDSHE